MHKLLFFTTVSTISINAMITQKEPGLPAPFPFCAPLKFVAKLPEGFWPPLVQIPVSKQPLTMEKSGDLCKLFAHVPGVKTSPDKGHQFELKTASFIRHTYNDVTRGFCMDLSIKSSEVKLITDFDVVTGDRIIECKSSSRLSRVKDQITKQLKMLTIIREIVKKFTHIAMSCEKQNDNIILKAGQYTLSSSWISKYVTLNSKAPLNAWKTVLVALASKTYAFCYPPLRKCGRRRLKLLKNEHAEIDFIEVTTA